MQDDPIETDELYEQLDYFLQNYGGERSIMSVSELDGYLTAIGCGKDLLHPNEWLRAIWGGDEDQPMWPSPAREEEFHSLVMLLHLEAVNGLINGDLAPVYLEHKDKDGKVTLIIEDWCVGFMRGAKLVGLAQSPDREFMDDVMASVRLFGTPAGWEKIDAMSDAETRFWKENLEPSIMRLAQFHHPEIQILGNDGPKIIH